MCIVKEWQTWFLGLVRACCLAAGEVQINECLFDLPGMIIDIFMGKKKNQDGLCFSCLLVNGLGVTAEGRAAGQSCCPQPAGEVNSK